MSDGNLSESQQISTLETQALLHLRNGVTGAEFEVLRVLAYLVRSELDISPVFQAVANVVIAKALWAGKLPPQKKGRRRDSTGKGPAIAREYYEQMDAGHSRSEDVVAELAEKYHKSGRQVLQLVHDWKDSLGGSDAASRAAQRAHWAAVAERLSGGRPPAAALTDQQRRENQERLLRCYDPVGHMDRQIAAALAKAKSLR